VIVPRIASGMRRTGRILFERPRIALWTLAALTCALVLVGVAALAALKADRWNAAPGSGGTMVVYLGEGSAPHGRVSNVDTTHLAVSVPGFAFSAYQVEFANGQRLCGIHQRDDGVLDGFLCV